MARATFYNKRLLGHIDDIEPQASISVPNASTHAQGDWLLPTLSLLCVAMQNDIPRV